eukprot:g55406.t1
MISKDNTAGYPNCHFVAYSTRLFFRHGRLTTAGDTFKLVAPFTRFQTDQLDDDTGCGWRWAKATLSLHSSSVPAGQAPFYSRLKASHVSVIASTRHSVTWISPIAHRGTLAANMSPLVGVAYSRFVRLFFRSSDCMRFTTRCAQVVGRVSWRLETLSHKMGNMSSKSKRSGSIKNAMPSKRRVSIPASPGSESPKGLNTISITPSTTITSTASSAWTLTAESATESMEHSSWSHTPSPSHSPVKLICKASSLTPPSVCSASLTPPAGSCSPEQHRPSPRPSSWCGSRITSRLFLGGRASARDIHGMKAAGVTHVLNVADNVVNHFESSFRYCNLFVKDYGTSTEVLTRVFLQAYDFAYTCLLEDPNNRLLVHCWVGENRSVTVVLALLMLLYQLNLRQSWELVTRGHGQCCPFPDYRRELVEFERRLYQSTTMELSQDSFQQSLDFSTSPSFSLPPQPVLPSSLPKWAQPAKPKSPQLSIDCLSKRDPVLPASSLDEMSPEGKITLSKKFCFESPDKDKENAEQARKMKLARSCMSPAKKDIPVDFYPRRLSRRSSSSLSDSASTLPPIHNSCHSPLTPVPVSSFSPTSQENVQHIRPFVSRSCDSLPSKRLASPNDLRLPAANWADRKGNSDSPIGSYENSPQALTPRVSADQENNLSPYALSPRQDSLSPSPGGSRRRIF